MPNPKSLRIITLLLLMMMIMIIVDGNYADELFRMVKFYSHQLMHFLIQPCISLLSYIKIT